MKIAIKVELILFCVVILVAMIFDERALVPIHFDSKFVPNGYCTSYVFYLTIFFLAFALYLSSNIKNEYYRMVLPFFSIGLPMCFPLFFVINSISIAFYIGGLFLIAIGVGLLVVFPFYFIIVRSSDKGSWGKN